MNPKTACNDYSAALRQRIDEVDIFPFIGAYDAFSGRLIAQHFDGVFCSGYGLSASQYGLADAGYITSSDVVDYVTRMRSVLDSQHILVDIDDGFGGLDVAINVTRRLEQVGASAIMMEDQSRPVKFQ